MSDSSRSRLPGGTFAARRTACGVQRGLDKQRHRDHRWPGFDMETYQVAGRGKPRSPFRQKGPTVATRQSIHYKG